MAVPVEVFVSDDTITPAPISGALVGVLNSTTLALIEQVLTDDAGRASFLLPGSVTGVVYEIRLYKLGVVFGSPKRISVLDPATSPNEFNVAGSVLTLPVATDSRLCRCTGRFVDYSNAPIKKMPLRISAEADTGLQVPKVVDGILVASSGFVVATDQNGRLEVDLFRGGVYYTMFPGEEEITRVFYVPNRSSANLGDLIFAYPVSLTWDQEAAPGNAVPLALGDSKDVPFTVLFSDYRIVKVGVLDFLKFTASNTNISLVTGEEVLTVTGRTQGSAEVSVEIVKDKLPSRIPDYALVTTPLSITVA